MFKKIFLSLNILKNVRPFYRALAISSMFFALSSTLEGLDAEIQKRIENLVQHNPGQLSVKEYSLIAETILNRAPCNVLVFGVGRDSSLWMDCNKGGVTTFLEDSPAWIQQISSEIPNLPVYKVTYNTKCSQWKKLIHKPKLLSIDLPTEVLQTKWDIIFVDGPTGYNKEQPGRMQSIYTASLLVNPAGSHIFVHDCNRPIEAAFCDKFLKPKQFVKSVDRLRNYFFKFE